MGPGGTQDHRGPHKTPKTGKKREKLRPPPDLKKSNFSNIIFFIAGPIFFF